jgi:D-3-phosphoglycerate dehydrogenase
MISRELLYSMKPTAYIVNCARGGVIDEDALIEVLKEKRIAGAGIDVFQQEPPELNNELLKLDNVLLSPHSAAMTKEAAIRMAIEAAEAVVDFIEGRMPKYIYNLKDLKEKGFI